MIIRVFPLLVFLFISLAAAYLIEDLILIASGVLIIMIAWQIIYLATVKYEITRTQIIYSRGVLSYETDYLEMYRVKDYIKKQSLIARILGIMNFTLITSDKSHPEFSMIGIQDSNIPDTVRKLVEVSRKTNRVLQVD
ncbi:PH domain-containing protein [Persicobacter diffluens]